MNYWKFWGWYSIGRINHTCAIKIKRYGNQSIVFKFYNVHIVAGMNPPIGVANHKLKQREYIHSFLIATIRAPYPFIRYFPTNSFSQQIIIFDKKACFFYIRILLFDVFIKHINHSYPITIVGNCIVRFICKIFHEGVILVFFGFPAMGYHFYFILSFENCMIN